MHQTIKSKATTSRAFQTKVAAIAGALIASCLLPYTTSAEFGDSRDIQATLQPSDVGIPMAPLGFFTVSREVNSDAEWLNFDRQLASSAASLTQPLESDAKLEPANVEMPVARIDFLALSRQMMGAEPFTFDMQPETSVVALSHPLELNAKLPPANIEMPRAKPSLASVPKPSDEHAMGAHTPTQRHAALDSLSRDLEPKVDRINFATPSLAPMSFVRFCMRKPDECSVQNTVSGPRPVELTKSRMAELVKVNHNVNRAIRPKANANGVVADEWQISPREGDCKDFAVTKRHELLKRGWPSNSLLLTEVVVPSGEHHVVLVVRTLEKDLVLDNLNRNVRPVSQVRYQWVRAQQADNPKFWSMISVTSAARVAMNAH
jgi:predicted transglutaminase-like cysteine proteinase